MVCSQPGHEPMLPSLGTYVDCVWLLVVCVWACVWNWSNACVTCTIRVTWQVCNREKSGLVRQDTARPWTWLEVHTLVSPQWKPFFLHRESILIQALWFHVVDDDERLITKAWVLCHLSLPLRTVFAKILFTKSNFPNDFVLLLTGIQRIGASS